MAKKFLINDEVQLHDLLCLFNKDDNVTVFSREGKVLFTLDEYNDTHSLVDDYGEQNVKAVVHNTNYVEVILWV